MILLRVNGEDFNNFIDMSVSNSLQALSGKFEFTATSDDQGNFPFTVGDKVQVLIKELDFLVGIANGFIDTISINYSKNTHTLRVSGRDKTEDIIDSHIKDIELGSGTGFTLTQVIQSVLKFLEISEKDIKVIDQVGKLDPFFKGEIGSAGQGETGFSFINKYAEKRQVLLSNDGDGNIVLTRVENPLRNGEILNIKNAPLTNNVKSAKVVYDHSQRFHDYSVISAANIGTECVGFAGEPTTKCGADQVNDLVNRQGKSDIDDDIRITRKFVLIPSATMTIDTATKRAEWERSLRIARSKKYHVTVQGFLSNDNLIWQAGQLVKVRDEFASINADLIVSEISYNFSVDGGSTTTLTLLPQDVYKPLLELDALKIKVNKMGDADSDIDLTGLPKPKGTPTNSQGGI